MRFGRKVEKCDGCDGKEAENISRLSDIVNKLTEFAKELK